MSVNKIILLGRLGKDPELYEGDNFKVIQFSVATSEKYKDKSGELQESTEWHQIKAYNKLAEVCAQYLEKGREVYVEGKLKTERYEKDGVERQKKVVVAQQVKFVGPKAQQQEQVIDPVIASSVQASQMDDGFEEDDIPF